MRRKDREITDFNSIIEIINRCDTIRIGLADGDYPYIVPVSFGYDVIDNQIVFYIHGSKEGRKIQLMTKKPVCSFEMDCDHMAEADTKKHKATMRYTSLMGKADIQAVSDSEKKHAAGILLNHYEATKGFDYNTEALSFTAFYKLIVREYTAKSNIK